MYRAFGQDGEFPVILMGMKHRVIEGIDVVFEMNFIYMFDGILVDIHCEIYCFHKILCQNAHILQVLFSKMITKPIKMSIFRFKNVTKA